MTLLVTIDAGAEAFGHPAECTEPAPGLVERQTEASLMVSSGGQTSQLASVNTANLFFSSHGHATDSNNNCTDYQEHTIDPDTTSSSLTLNGSPLYIEGSDVGTDPASGGSVDITDAGINNSITES